MDRAGLNVQRLTEDELRLIFDVVGQGRTLESALRAVTGRDRVTVSRAYNVASSLHRRGQAPLTDHEALEVAKGAKYGTTQSYVQDLYLRHRAWLQRRHLEDGKRVESRSEPGVLAGEVHFRELAYFGQCLRDRIDLFPPQIATRGENQNVPQALWRGRRATECGEEAVEKDWPLGRYDARCHPLFPSFYRHLEGAKCWQALAEVEASFGNYYKACACAARFVFTTVGELGLGLSQAKEVALSEAALTDSLNHLASTKWPGMAVGQEKVQAGGEIYWQLRIGAWQIRASDPSELQSIADSFERLVKGLTAAREVAGLVDARNSALEAIDLYRKTLQPDARLRRQILLRQCRYCP